MFTGLVQDIGVIRSVDRARGDLCAEIETSLNLEMIQVGASICCSGCCLTVTRKSEKSFFVDVSQETLSRTNLGAWEVMTRVNLEQSLKMGDELGGHFVFGHVDAVVEILDIRKEGESHRLKIALPQSLRHLVASKGSVTLDGVSLTVNDVETDYFGVNIIPHTWAQTTLGSRVAGNKFNLEIDMLARYVARMMDVRT